MTIHLNINLAGPRGVLQRIVQRAIDLVAFGLTAGETVPEGQLTLPGITMQFTAAGDYVLSPAQAKEEFSLWTLQNGFRDAVEGVQEFLEEARVACAALALGPRYTAPAGWDPPFNRESAEGRAFHFMGIREKLERLRQVYGIGLSMELEASVLSINQARNCLAHRRGVVGALDCREADGFRIRRRGMRFFLKNDATGAEVPLVLNQVVEAQSTLLLRIVNADRLFRVGDRLTVTTEEFTDCCFTLLTAANELGLTIDEFGRARGFNIPRPPQPLTGEGSGGLSAPTPAHPPDSAAP